MAMPLRAPPPDRPRFGWTAERVRVLPDDGYRYECVDGELFVTPAPRYVHQLVISELMRTVGEHALAHGVGRLLTSPADIEFDSKSLLQPDLFLVPAHLRPQHWSDVRGMPLIIEVLSPSTTRADRTVKRARYQRARVPEYWVVDATARCIERWRPDDTEPERITGELLWQPPGEAAALRLDLVRFFAELVGPADGKG